ncbi:FAD:protein FMN transferase [Vibrio lentus]|nr:FAD:protein FMN transferase [Vibrio lentus]
MAASSKVRRRPTVTIGKQLGATSMLVNFGGDIYALGTKPDGSAFNIAVLDPRTARPHFRAVPLTGSAHDFGSQ